MATILIIDDEENFQKMLRANFVARGYDVASAREGEEGLRLTQLNHPDLIMLDLKLPDISGWDVLDRLKGNPELKDIPVIVMTASTTRPRESRMQGQIASFMTKPFGADELMQQVIAALGE